MEGREATLRSPGSLSAPKSSQALETDRNLVELRNGIPRAQQWESVWAVGPTEGPERSAPAGPAVTLTGTVRGLLPQADQEEETIGLQNALSVGKLSPSMTPASGPSSGGSPGPTSPAPDATAAPAADPSPERTPTGRHPWAPEHQGSHAVYSHPLSPRPSHSAASPAPRAGRAAGHPSLSPMSTHTPCRPLPVRAGW